MLHYSLGDSKNKRMLKYYIIYSFNLAGMDEWHFTIVIKGVKKVRQYHSYKNVMFLFCTSCLLNKTQWGEKILISVQKRFQAYLKLSASGFFKTIISGLQASASMQRWNKNNTVIRLDLVIKFSLKENKSQNEKC